MVAWTLLFFIACYQFNSTTLTLMYNRDTDGRPYSYTYHHFADARHATEAITGSAEEYIHQHVQRKHEGEGKRPILLFQGV
jgi:hypothetical protein